MNSFLAASSSSNHGAENRLGKRLIYRLIYKTEVGFGIFMERFNDMFQSTI